MANLTISVDEELLQRARLRALLEGTSVNAVLRDYLARYAGMNQEQQEAAQAILRLSHEAASRHEGPRWPREELYER
ncbi:MAG: hypothetical protein KGZ60_02430 [Truepera sp.]|nr:hypothetical protein [Truepera sp.]